MCATHMLMLVTCAATTRCARRSPSRPKQYGGNHASRQHVSTRIRTHELELHGRSWRCRWCTRSGKELMEECTGERPKLKATFNFRSLTKKAVKKARGRKIWGRRKAPRRAGVQQRQPGGPDAVKTSLQAVWPRFSPPVQQPNKVSDAVSNTRAATTQGEHDAQLFGRPPERGWRAQGVPPPYPMAS